MTGEYSDRVNKLRKAIADGSAEMQVLRQQRQQTQTDLNNSQRELDSIASELEEVSTKLRDAGDDRRRSKQEEKLNGAIETMKRIFPGVLGKLEDLCKPIQRRYALAVSVTAGKHMDAIVVESRQVAQECIGYLKDQRIGTCAFLPLDNLLTAPIPSRTPLVSRL